MHVDALPAGTRLAEFEVTSLLGVGGFGMVYKAFDHSLHRPVAIKEYMPSALAGRVDGLSVGLRSSSDVASFESGLRGFLSEARLLAQFDHPSLVKVFRFWEANGTAYMVMPFYQGMTLKQARAQMRCPPPEEWLRKVIGAMLGALQVLHEGRTLHRDVSPDNIFLQDLGPPVLLDLGAARRALSDQTHKHTAILKVNYAPIEQYADAEDMRQGPWTDLYSLAAVVYDCLCNKPPAPATFRIIKDRMLPLADVARVVATEFGIHYSDPFVTGLASALQVRPERRPDTTAALGQALGIESPVEGLVRFDWRAELGDIWVPPGVEPGAPILTQPADATTVQIGRSAPDEGVETDVDLSSPVEVAALAEEPPAPQPPAASPEAVAEPRPQPTPAPVPAPSTPDHAPVVRARFWVALGMVLVLAGGAGAWRFWQARHTPDADIITEMAEPAPAKPAAPEPSPVASGTGSVQAPAPAVPGKAEPVEEILSGKSDPDASSSVKPAAKPPVTPSTATARKPVPAPVPVTKAPPEPPPPPKVESEVKAPAPAPHAAPAPASGSQLCADANVFTRTMCMYHACARPENAATVACVEYRRGMQERSVRPYSP